MMSATGIGGLDALTKKVLHAIENKCSVIDCIYLGSCQGLRVLICPVR
jgi:hypothetical protein